LHVDDDACFLKTAKAILEMQSAFQVETVSSVEEAREKMKTREYDAVVSDYQMPGKDGLQFLKELRQEGNRIPFIIFTGKGREEVVIKALNLGADNYINKHSEIEMAYAELAHYIRDAVDRKKAEEALRTERDRLEIVTESIGAGLAVISEDYRILWANKVIKRLFGDVEGKTCYSTYDQRSAICPKCGVREVFESGKDKAVHEQVGKGVDGKIIWSESIVTPIKDKGGKVTAAVEVVVPVTERKKAEEEIESLAIFLSENPNPILRIAKDGVILYANAAAKSILSELKIGIGQLAPHQWRRLVSDALDSGLRKEVEAENEDRMFLFIITPVANSAYVNAYGIDVTERNKALERLSILNEKLRVVGKLTKHDVRNKLSAVLGNTYLAEKTLPNDHKALAYLKEIELACLQTTRVLDFAAAYESLGVEGLTLMDVDKAVEEAVSLISELKGVKIMNNCQGLTVMADSVLRQLFFNLIQNSLKHGKNVSQIKIHYEEGKDRLKLLYEDDGVGISKADKPKLFEGGFTTGNGSGYGLYLIKRMMDIYGWTIEEEGEPGKGAKFVISIPKTHITMRARNT
jgi:PAS domain S-box-containing protein